MDRRYIYSLLLGLFMLFELQLISYLNWLLVYQDVISGVQDKYLLLKTPLILIPLLCILYFSYGLFRK